MKFSRRDLQVEFLYKIGLGSDQGLELSYSMRRCVLGPPAPPHIIKIIASGQGLSQHR